MKSSRIFLGLTTACLVVAGIVTAKNVRFGSSSQPYYVTNGFFKCVPIALISGIAYSINSTTVLYFTTAGSPPLYIKHRIPTYYTSNCFILFTYKK